jgi:hypothetical protein
VNNARSPFLAGAPFMENSMASLSVEFKSKTMATSTRMFRMLAGIEQLYYAQVLTGDRARAADPETWRGWYRLGFHMSVKNPPPAVRDNERVKVTMDVSGEPDLVINVEGGEAKALGALQSLLKEIDQARAKRGPESEEARLAAVKADPAVAAALVKPLHEALEKTGCGYAAGDFDFALDRALKVLAHPEISSLRAR